MEPPKMLPGKVRREPVFKLLMEYLSAEELSWNGDGGGYTLSPVLSLAIRARVNPDTLMGALAGRRDTIDFDIADRLLCAAGLEHLWRTKLLDVYMEVDLSGPSRVKPWVVELEDRDCLGCGKTFPAITNYKPTKQPVYCGTTCAAIKGMNDRWAREAA